MHKNGYFSYFFNEILMRIIVNADDFGYSKSVNDAISKSFSYKYISQTTIMINMPFVDEGIIISKEQGFFNKIGLHLNLTEGIPLTNNIKNNRHYTNTKGEFNASLINCKRYRFYIPQKDKKCIMEEIDAQMKKYKELGFPLMHMDSHHHIHNNISLIFLISRFAKKNGFKSMRICRNMDIVNYSYLKIAYKLIVNKIIRSSFRTVKYFAEYSAYNKCEFINSDIEIMVHPDIVNGEIVDIIKKNERCEKLSNYRYEQAIISTY